MNKRELIAKLAKDTGLSKAGAAVAVDSMIEGVSKSLKKGDAITKQHVVRFSAGQTPRVARPTTND